MTKISAFVITCDRYPWMLRAALKRVRWVDELILVDKGKIKVSAFEMAGHPLIDRYVYASWTPLVEDTLAYAESLCSHDWIIRLDDDEILNDGAEVKMRAAVEADLADVFYCPIRHRIMGKWEPDVFPDRRPVLARRGHRDWSPALHGGTKAIGRICLLDNVSIAHLSHADVAGWIRKANFYTDQENRVLSGAAQKVMDDIAQQPNPYKAAVDLQLAIYDAIDGLKRWEKANLPDGHAVFRQYCEDIAKE